MMSFLWGFRSLKKFFSITKKCSEPLKGLVFSPVTTLTTIHSHSLDLQKSVCDTIQKKGEGL